ncbi:glycosyltransferase family 2 protein [Suttonella sp. R2A3]|uniref:glycosyltransferase family 2 protein n=1 Tax=Suttonella sp. R2A3 TaxID=2908648 RepID=UPI001F425176|nr:glycosyltransferase family 2 protein [Suttonella sp. R2A3]UJF24433.1 glycosyltransferase family 2 protein [Suttonella sp. R2A3]
MKTEPVNQHALSYTYSIVIPAYNDAEALKLFVPQLYPLLERYQGQHEIVIVDDGSKDALLEAFEDLQETLPETVRLKLVRFSRNFGKEAALSAGLQAAQGEAVVMMDADGQHPVSMLEQMITHYERGADVVAAVQVVRDQERLFARWLKKRFYRFMQDAQRYQLKANAGDFRLMRRKVVDALLALPERQRFMKGLYAWVGFDTVYLPFNAAPRQDGSSKFQYRDLFDLAMVGITSFSLKPLRWISRMGIVVSLLAFIYGLFIVFDTLFTGRDVAGWTTLSAGIMFSAGLQLICIGVIGEYVGRIYEEVKQRPLYVVDEVYDSSRRPKDEH